MKVDEGDTARTRVTTTTTTIREQGGGRLEEALRQLGDVHIQVG